MAIGASILAGKGHVSLGVDASMLEKGLNAASDRLRSWGGNIARIGAQIAAAGIGMISGLAPGVMMFANYEQALADLRAAANPTTEQMAQLRAQIEAVGKATGTDLVEVTKAYSELLKAGVSLDLVLSGVGETAIKFARVSGMEMAQTAVVLIDAMNVFARENINASAAANIMNQAADASTTSLREVSEAFAAGGSTMALFNQSMRDTATAIAILGNSGIKGADAGTVLKTMMLRIATGSETAGAAIAELGLNVRDSSGQILPMVQIIGQLQTAMAGRGQADRDRLMSDLAGDRGIRGLAILLQNGTAGWERMQASMGTSLTVEQKFAIMTETLIGSLKKAWVHVQAIAVAVGEALQPALAVIGSVLLPILQMIEQFARENKAAIITIAGIAVALVTVGAALMGLGGAAILIGSAMGAIVVAFKFLVIAVAVVVSLWVVFELIRATMNALGISVEQVFAAISDYFSILTPAAERFGETMRAMWQGVTDAVMAGDMALAFEIVSETMRLIWTRTVNWFRDGWFSFVHLFDSSLDAMIFSVGRSMIAIAGTIARELNRIIDAMPEFIRNQVGITRIEFDADAASRALEATAVNREREFSATHDEERARALAEESGIQSEIDRAILEAEIARIYREMIPGGGTGVPSLGTSPGGMGVMANSLSVGAFGRDFMLGAGQFAQNPEQRAAADRARANALLAEVRDGIAALREEVAPRFT